MIIALPPLPPPALLSEEELKELKKTNTCVKEEKEALVSIDTPNDPKIVGFVFYLD